MIYVSVFHVCSLLNFINCLHLSGPTISLQCESEWKDFFFILGPALRSDESLFASSEVAQTFFCHFDSPLIRNPLAVPLLHTFLYMQLLLLMSRGKVKDGRVLLLNQRKSYSNNNINSLTLEPQRQLMCLASRREKKTPVYFF